MDFQISNIEKEMLQRVFGEGASPERLSLAENDPDDDETIYLSELGAPIKTILEYEFDSPTGDESYSIVSIEHKGIGLLLADMEYSCGMTIVLGLSAVLSVEFIQNALINWWHSENGCPPTRFSIKDHRFFSSDFIWRFFDNEIRKNFMEDDVFSAWIEKNLNVK